MKDITFSSNCDISLVILTSIFSYLEHSQQCSQIAILVTPKHKNPHYNSGVKGKIFTFIATMQSYIWLCTVAKNFIKKNYFTFTLLFFLFLLSFSFLYVNAHCLSVSSFFLHRPNTSQEKKNKNSTHC